MTVVSLSERASLTNFICFFVPRHEHFAVSAFAHDSFQLVFLHSFAGRHFDFALGSQSTLIMVRLHLRRLI